MNSPEKIKKAVRRAYSRFIQTGEADFGYPTGREGAERLGYGAELLERLPDGMVKTFCGVGNPFSLGNITPGEAVLDVGCGGGLDLARASRLTGADGFACGVDLTPEAARRAKMNLESASARNSAVVLSDVEALPFIDETFDVVISNGAFNLIPDKKRAFGEIFRALKRGGCLQFADLVLKGDLPEEMIGSLEAWSQ